MTEVKIRDYKCSPGTLFSPPGTEEYWTCDICKLTDCRWYCLENSLEWDSYTEDEKETIEKEKNS